MFVTEDEFSEELKAARRLLSGSIHDPEETYRVSDRYCHSKDAVPADKASKDEYIVGDRKSKEKLDL